MTPRFKAIEEELFGDPSDGDLALCVEALEPVVRGLKQKGLPTNAIIAALAEVTVVTVDRERAH